MIPFFNLLVGYVSKKALIPLVSCLVKTYMFVQKKGEIGKKANEKKP